MSNPSLHPRIAEVIAALTEGQAALEAIVSSLTAEQAAARMGAGWTVAQIVEHLAVVEDGSGRVVSNLIKAAAGTTEHDETPVAPTLDRFRIPDATGHRIEAPEMVAPREGLPLETSMARLREARARLIAAFERGAGLALGTATLSHPALGPLSAYQWGHFVAQHQQRHLTQIRTILAVPS